MDVPGPPDGAPPAVAYRILVVDDDPDMRTYLRLCLLGGFGAATVIVEAADGVEALAAAHVHRPHVIITDLVMPRMDGYGLCEAVRADVRLHATPILLISGASSGGDTSAIGTADGFLPKRFNAHLLLEHLQPLLSR